MRKLIRSAFLVVLVISLQACSDLGSEPAWNSWPHYTYRQLQYALPSLSGAVGPTVPNPPGLWSWKSDSVGTLWIQFLYIKDQGTPYYPQPGDQKTDIQVAGHLGTLYLTNVSMTDRWYLMAYFPDVGDPGYQLVFYANGPKGLQGQQSMRSVADQIIASFRFHRS